MSATSRPWSNTGASSSGISRRRGAEAGEEFGSSSFLSALFHVIVAVPPGRHADRRELERGQNRFRWIEYSMSATLMIVIIATITGITEMAALIAIAAANVAMILFGWVMEVVNRPGEPVWWAPFWSATRAP